MAHFYGTVAGQARTEGARRGSKNSGLTVYCNGWNSGITVRAHFDEGQIRDVFEVWLTAGSNGGKNPVLLGTFTALDLDKKGGKKWTK